MTVLQVDGVSFGYGADILFEEVTFSLELGERMALVAPNGQGKSSLLGLIVGSLVPDEGRVMLPKGTRVGYLRQSHEPDTEGRVLDVLLAPFAAARAARDELRAAENGAAEGTEQALDRLARAQDAIHATGADAIEREVSRIAHRVGFSDADLERAVLSLSGGERGRLQLAAVLVAKPELLLLDEPTNHLDLESVEWLEGFVRSYPGAVIIVSHDRAFLDATCTRTAELGLFRFRLYPVKYSDYVVQREADLERERAAVMQQRAEISRTEDFIRRNLAGQNTNQAKSRRRMLGKLERLENPEDIWADARKLGLRFAPSRRTGDIVIDAEGLRAVRGGRTLFDGIQLRVRRLERLAIVGPNGSGKTTLLKLLADKASEGDGGSVRHGTNLDAGYFDQHLETLEPSRSCIDEVRSVRPDMVVDAARQYLSQFRFWGDDPFRAVGSLSGGERTRLALAKLLLVSRNLLYLDEPTNHLDIPACEILEEALVRFDGTVLFVSHDRRFLERVATRVVHLENATATIHNGTYSEFVAERARLGRPAVSAVAPERPERTPRTRRDSFDTARRASRDVERRARRIEELDKMLATGQEQLRELRTRLSQAPGENWEQIAKMADDEQQLVRRLDGWTEEWMLLSEKKD